MRFCIQQNLKKKAMNQLFSFETLTGFRKCQSWLINPRSYRGMIGIYTNLVQLNVFHELVGELKLISIDVVQRLQFTCNIISQRDKQPTAFNQKIRLIRDNTHRIKPDRVLNCKCSHKPDRVVPIEGKPFKRTKDFLNQIFLISKIGQNFNSHANTIERRAIVTHRYP